MNLHQTPEEIIKAATPEQRLLWNALFRLCGERMSLSQLSYTGAPAGTEFLTYTARKLYFALNISFGSANSSNNLAQGLITLYNEGNAAHYNTQNQCGLYDGAGAAPVYWHNNLNMDNIYFSRFLVGARITWMKFCGYRIQY